ncbi:unnamed protein product [Haemonchus placei]|uniref:Reverse transcriptase domain-containing protein n=1 Tax=Haemonchus placei TaxID=6290 RepID=A0A0N4W5E8_HAEPC|nr:unnamed protein product [Haemonchus placei]
MLDKLIDLTKMAGLKVNSSKTKWMSNNRNGQQLGVNDEEIELCRRVSSSFIYLSQLKATNAFTAEISIPCANIVHFTFDGVEMNAVLSALVAQGKAKAGEGRIKVDGTPVRKTSSYVNIGRSLNTDNDMKGKSVRRQKAAWVAFKINSIQNQFKRSPTIRLIRNFALVCSTPQFFLRSLARRRLG